MKYCFIKLVFSRRCVALTREPFRGKPGSKLSNLRKVTSFLYVYYLFNWWRKHNIWKSVEAPLQWAEFPGHTNDYHWLICKLFNWHANITKTKWFPLPMKNIHQFLNSFASGSPTICCHKNKRTFCSLWCQWTWLTLTMEKQYAQFFTNITSWEMH